MTDRTEPAVMVQTDTPLDRSLRGRGRRVRARARRHPRTNQLWRVAIGVLGAAVVALGVVLIPYPGPGWLVVFAGLGILSTEFAWAARLLRQVRHRYDGWVAWTRRQNLAVKLLVGLATCAVVVATLWLVDALYLMATWVGLDRWTWLESPLAP